MKLCYYASMSRLKLTSALAPAQQNTASLVGATRDCFQNKMYRPADVDIYLLDPAKSNVVVTILHEMQTDSANNDWDDFFPAYERFEKAVRHTKALGHVRSDKVGAFQFRNLRPGVRVLVIGIQDREDEAAFYATQDIESPHPGKNEIILDFARHDTCY
jgi:hypothetical protein